MPAAFIVGAKASEVDANIAGAGLDELGRLRDILAQDQSFLGVVIDLEMLHCRHRGASVGGMLGIGDGDLFDRRIP